MKRLEVFLLPLDGMLVHRRSLPRNFVRFPQQIAGTHLYTWVERGTVRVKCLAQEHNTLSPARARTRTAPESSVLTMRPPRCCQQLDHKFKITCQYLFVVNEIPIFCQSVTEPPGPDARIQILITCLYHQLRELIYNKHPNNLQ